MAGRKFRYLGIRLARGFGEVALDFVEAVKEFGLQHGKAGKLVEDQSEAFFAKLARFPCAFPEVVGLLHFGVCIPGKHDAGYFNKPVKRAHVQFLRIR